MLKADIQIGETYLFVGSESPKRQHLTGHPFTVVEAKDVFRKISWNHGRRSAKVTRFFNDDLIGARADELEPLPGENAPDWKKAHIEPPPVDGIYTVLTECLVYTRTEFKGGRWAYDLECEEMYRDSGIGRHDSVERWLLEKTRGCAGCHQMLPATYFETAGSAKCMACEKPAIDF